MTETKPKHLLRSKTAWLNVVLLIGLEVVNGFVADGSFSPEVTAWLVRVALILNIVMRTITKDPVRIK